MKPIARLLALFALAGGAVAAAPPGFTPGPCSFTCVDGAGGKHKYTITSLYAQCCSPANLCPPGMTITYKAWGDPPQVCPPTGGGGQPD